ncbi:diguanylate cyclase domain-containing protein [Alicyclobacillus contaminans]|uniref:diguanylate cyclase domain-containing protein n=1 Tax=Alicyclobacillus contaminans TaxID=392016 RepID=UPI00146FC1DF|nr:diguanylate cyclase [Alicyclobacillus contaminans]
MVVGGGIDVAGVASSIMHSVWISLGIISVFEFLNMREQALQSSWSPVFDLLYDWIPMGFLVLWIEVMDGVGVVVLPLYILLLTSLHRRRQWYRLVNLLVLWVLQVELIVIWHRDPLDVMSLACCGVSLLAILWSPLRDKPGWGYLAVVAIGAVNWVLAPGVQRLSTLAEIIVVSAVFLLYVHDARLRYKIREESERDPLTGLLNRRGGEIWLQKHRGAEGVAVLVDLDDFKFINDSFGHDAGDLVLQETARRFRACASPETAAVRWGGDEFLLLIPQPWTPSLKLAIERLFDAISGTPVEVHNEPLMVRCSMGVGYGMVNDELITEADRALLRAKQVGKDRIGWPDALEAFKSVWSEASVYGFSRAFNHLTRNSAVPCLATDANYVIVDVNPAFEQLSGYSRRELIGNKPSQLAAGEFNRSKYQEIRNALETDGCWEGQLCNQRPDGSVWWEDLTMSAIRVGEKVVGYWAIAREVQAPRVPAALRLMSFAERYGLPAFVSDAHQRIQRVNGAFATMYGKQVRNLVGKPVMEARSPMMNRAKFEEMERDLQELGIWLGVTTNQRLPGSEVVPVVSGVVRSQTDGEGSEEETVEIQVPLTRIIEEWENITGKSRSMEAIFLRALARVAEWGDPDLQAHVLRVSNYARWLATRLAERNLLHLHDVETIAVASVTHDIGKVAIAREVLLKPHHLQREEYGYVKAHALIGEQILQSVLENLPNFYEYSRALVDCARVIAGTHHEWWDGSGYPRGLLGEAIPLPGRIVAVADVLDALLSRRPYKDPWSKERVRAYMQEHRGTQFDPQIIDVLLAEWDSLPDPKDSISATLASKEGQIVEI